jgi:myo-inositol-1(or 4)-monophosphatase
VARTWGDCYGYLLLCSGWADIVVDPIMNPWDLLPLVPVVRGAGGHISDWHGVQTDWLQRDSTVATTPALAQAVLEALR